MEHHSPIEILTLQCTLNTERYHITCERAHVNENNKLVEQLSESIIIAVHVH